jgi:hypothetical protein
MLRLRKIFLACRDDSSAPRRHRFRVERMNIDPHDLPPQVPAEPERVSLLSSFWPALVGALVGIFLRIIFSGGVELQETEKFIDKVSNGVASAMSGFFIYFAPIAVSAVSVYLAERTRRRSWSSYFWTGAMANALFVLGTLVVLIEGLICAIIIVPLFMFIGGLGGLIMGAICRWMIFPRTSVLSFVTLPVVLALVVPPTENVPLMGVIERSVIVNAAPEKVWPHLLNAERIQPNEVAHGWLYRIGVPLPEAGVTARLDDGKNLVRHITMGKKIHFEQRSNEWRENQFVHWKYRFADDSFPPHALDDHVKIGGDFFDIIDTRYSLAPLTDGTTQLSVKIHYRVSTDFNWYANGVAKLLIGNFEDVILDFYRVRSERSATAPSPKPI